VRGAIVIVIALGATGCAAIIGASFDDAGLPSDAASDVRDSGPLFDVALFDPSSLPNLGFWIDASRGVDLGEASTRVARWHDLSMHSHDAVPAGQGTNAPTLVPNAQNGLPVVHFTAQNYEMLTTGWVGPGTAEVTLFLVTRGYAMSMLRFQSNSSAYPFILFPVDVNQSEAAPAYRFMVGMTSPTYIQIVVDVAATGATLMSGTWRSNGTAATYLDGALVEQRVTSIPLPSGLLYIGGVLPLLASPNTVLPFADGDLAEAIVYTSALSDDDMTKVVSYLHTKWGL
jgi:hypothetical protein